MNIEERFLEYAAAFEESYEDNDWSRLAVFFTETASYDNGEGEAAHGRDAVLAKLRGSVDGLDRLMDSRGVQLRSLTSEGDTVTMEWTASYTKAGLPDLEFKGTEYARFEGDGIAELRDELVPGSGEILGAWLDAHGASLVT
jgi:hypothetical protein